jgi:RNA polymerase sigma-70 factor (ECF subfamily)
VNPEIVKQAQAGDHRALERLLELVTPRLLRLATRLAGEVELAEELTEDALFRGARKLAGLKEAGAVEAWFRRILINLWRDELRRRRGGDLSLEDLPEPEAPPAFDPTQRATAREVREQVSAALAGLPPAQRLAMVLRVDEGLSMAEIAEQLNTTVDRVKANLWHARRRLRGALQGLLDETPQAEESV